MSSNKQPETPIIDVMLGHPDLNGADLFEQIRISIGLYGEALVRYVSFDDSLRAERVSALPNQEEK